MPDLRTTYLGLDLAHPVVASPSPLSTSLDGIRRLEDGGVSAIVLFSLFEEQIQQENAALEALTSTLSNSVAEAMSYFPDPERYLVGPDAYLDLVRQAKEAVDVPVIASLNGVTDEGWTDYARLLQEAGADALELNIFHLPTDLRETARGVEERYLEIVRAITHELLIPVAVKLHPYFSAVGEMAHRLAHAGVDGLVLFNRFYQPDIDLEALEVAPSLSLSSPTEIRLPLLWIGVLYGRYDLSLAATTGVWTEREVAKYLLAGADVTMTTAALLKYGPEYARTLVDGLNGWMDRRGFTSVLQMKGAMSQQRVANPTAFERANYLKILQSWEHPYV